MVQVVCKDTLVWPLFSPIFAAADIQYLKLGLNLASVAVRTALLLDLNIVNTSRIVLLLKVQHSSQSGVSHWVLIGGFFDIHDKSQRVSEIFHPPCLTGAFGQDRFSQAVTFCQCAPSALHNFHDVTGQSRPLFFAVINAFDVQKMLVTFQRLSA